MPQLILGHGDSLAIGIETAIVIALQSMGYLAFLDSITMRLLPPVAAAMVNITLIVYLYNKFVVGNPDRIFGGILKRM